jgi:hypothetical protein
VDLREHRGDLWGSGQIFPLDGDRGWGIFWRVGWGKLPPFIPRPIDIPNQELVENLFERTFFLVKEFEIITKWAKKAQILNN